MQWLYFLTNPCKREELQYFLEIFVKKRVNWYARSLFVEFRMKLYVQLMILFVISLIGEGTQFLSFAIQAVLSVWLFFLTLQFKWLRAACQYGRGISCWPIWPFFLPPAVGIMEKVRCDCSPISAYRLDCFFWAVINIILIHLVVQFIKRRFEGDYEKGDAKWAICIQSSVWDCII